MSYILTLIINNKKNIFLVLLGSFIALILSHLFYSFKINNLNNEYTIYKTTVDNSIQQSKINLLEQSNKNKEDNFILNKKLKDLENENYSNFTKLQEANKTIKSNIASGNHRLYINAKCPATNSSSGETEDRKTSGLDDGETSRVVIDSRNAQSIISITEKADKYKIQLEALQNWVNMLLLENNK